MQATKVSFGQTLIDITIQQTGDLTKLFEVAQLNDKSITDDVVSGETLTTGDPDFSKRNLVLMFNNSANRPASGFTEELQEGIEYWGIEVDFIVN